jgi:PPP family 3-phenylpropionic acid transporter
MSSAPKVPYGRLSGFYFFYFGQLGAIMPYWALYLERQGFLPPEIGLLMAIPSVTKVLAPNFWGWWADRSGRTLGLIRLSSFLTLCSFGLIVWLGSFGGLALIMLLSSFFQNGVLPLFETVTLDHLDRDSHRYAKVRIWGSVGFVASVVAVGEALETVLAIECLPFLIILLLAGIWLVSLVIPPCREAFHSHGKASLLGIVTRGDVIAFFLACMLQQFAHGPYYVFFSVYLEEYGFSKGHIGQLWALGVLAEITLFMFVPRILGCFSLRSVFLSSLALGGARWLLIAWGIDRLELVLIAQILHAASFGAAHIAAIHLVHGYFRGPYHGTGQALYSSLSFGLGGALGSIFAGYFWDLWGAHWIYTVAAGASVLAFLIAWPRVGRENRQLMT